MPSSYTVGEHFERFIREQIETGRYPSASEVVRDALRLLEKQEHMRLAALNVLRDEIRKGQDSGAGAPAEEVFARLEGRYAARAQQ